MMSSSVVQDPANGSEGANNVVNSPVEGQNEDKQKILAQQEEQLKSRFPTAVRPGGSLFLQKKLLQRGGQKFFDSGDYNMARGQNAKLGPVPKLQGKTITGAELRVPNVPTGQSHPSPDMIPARKTSLSTSKLASGSPPLPGQQQQQQLPSHRPHHPLAGAPIPPPSLD